MFLLKIICWMSLIKLIVIIYNCFDCEISIWSGINIESFRSEDVLQLPTVLEFE